jgi:hypothetical protein
MTYPRSYDPSVLNCGNVASCPYISPVVVQKNNINHFIISRHVHFNNQQSKMSDNRQAGGHKANLNNPNTSEESKQHSREVLDGSSRDGPSSTSRTSHSHEGKNPGNGTYSITKTKNSCGRLQSHFEKPQCQWWSQAECRGTVEQHVEMWP